MEGVINSVIKQRLLSNNVLSDAWFGFRQDCSALDLITALVRTWTKELNSAEVGMFADDCAMFSTIHDSSDTELVHVQMQQIWTISMLGLKS
eukprot:g35248.t1